MPINSIREHLKSVSSNCKIDATCHRTVKCSGSNCTEWFQLLTTWKHTECSLRYCIPAKAIFIKCLKDLKRFLSENKKKAFKTQGTWILDGFSLYLCYRHVEVPHKCHSTSCNPWRNFSSQKNFCSQWTKQIICTLILIHSGKLRQRELIRHPLGAGLNFLFWPLHELELPTKRKLLTSNPGCKSRLQ